MGDDNRRRLELRDMEPPPSPPRTRIGISLMPMRRRLICFFEVALTDQNDSRALPCAAWSRRSCLSWRWPSSAFSGRARATCRTRSPICRRSAVRHYSEASYLAIVLSRPVKDVGRQDDDKVVTYLTRCHRFPHFPFANSGATLDPNNSRLAIVCLWLNIPAPLPSDKVCVKSAMVSIPYSSSS